MYSTWGKDEFGHGREYASSKYSIYTFAKEKVVKLDNISWTVVLYYKKLTWFYCDGFVFNMYNGGIKLCYKKVNVDIY